MKHVTSKIDDGEKVFQIIQGVDLLQFMRWVNQALEQITKDTIKHCFEKCGFPEVSLPAEEPDETFEDLLRSLTIDLMPDEYASFDDDVDTWKCQSMCKRKAGKIYFVSMHRKN